MAELDPMTRRRLVVRAAGLVLLYGATAVVMGVGLFLLVQVFSGSFRYVPVPGNGAGRSGAVQTPRP